MSEIDTVRRYIQAKPQLRQRTKRTDVESALDSLLARLAAVEAERDEANRYLESVRGGYEVVLSDCAAAEARVEAAEQLIADGIEAFRLTIEYVGEMLPAAPGWVWFDWSERARAALSSLPSGPLTPEPEQEGAK